MKHNFKVSVNHEAEENTLTINVDGHEIGVKILCYFDDDDTQIIDILETMPGNMPPYRLAFLAYGQETKTYYRRTPE